MVSFRLASNVHVGTVILSTAKAERKQGSGIAATPSPKTHNGNFRFAHTTIHTNALTNVDRDIPNIGSMRISRVRLAHTLGNLRRDTILQRVRWKKYTRKIGRQKATKGGNEFVAM
jgi:hypothetical protein